MAEIGLELNRIRQICDEIKGLDETLISRYFNELYGILSGIESTVNQDDNVFGTIGRITRNADNIAQKLGSSLKSLENFIDTQLEDYSRNENTAYDRLRAVLEKMARLIGLDISKLNIDSTPTVINPTVSGNGGSYYTPAAGFGAAAGAAGMVGYMGGKYKNLTPEQMLEIQEKLRAEGLIREGDPTPVEPAEPRQPITYLADSIPSLNRSSAVGPDGRRFNVWVGDDNRIYDENGDLMTSMYMTKNGAIVETADMEYFIKRCGDENKSYEYYRKLYASQNGIKYEQVKDEYLTPEFIAKCDSDYINYYMPADGTDLDVAKEFKAVAESRVPGITGGLGDETPAGNGVPEAPVEENPGSGRNVPPMIGKEPTSPASNQRDVSGGEKKSLERILERDMTAANAGKSSQQPGKISSNDSPESFKPTASGAAVTATGLGVVGARNTINPNSIFGTEVEIRGNQFYSKYDNRFLGTVTSDGRIMNPKMETIAKVNPNGTMIPMNPTAVSAGANNTYTGTLGGAKDSGLAQKNTYSQQGISSGGVTTSQAQPAQAGSIGAQNALGQQKSTGGGNLSNTSAGKKAAPAVNIVPKETLGKTSNGTPQMELLRQGKRLPERLSPPDDGNGGNTGGSGDIDRPPASDTIQNNRDISKPIPTPSNPQFGGNTSPSAGGAPRTGDINRQDIPISSQGGIIFSPRNPSPKPPSNIVSQGPIYPGYQKDPGYPGSQAASYTPQPNAPVVNKGTSGNLGGISRMFQ